ncbi:hypothetical protein CBL_04409 [Carabus blaptoides fortunei]
MVNDNLNLGSTCRLSSFWFKPAGHSDSNCCIEDIRLGISEIGVIDLIGKLPVELSCNIFRYLDHKSLGQVVGVCKQWKNICKGDIILRRRIRNQLKKERKERVQAYLEPSRSVQITRDLPGSVLGKRNGPAGVEVTSLRVNYEVPKVYRRPQARKFNIGEDTRKRSLKRKADDYEVSFASELHVEQPATSKAIKLMQDSKTTNPKTTMSRISNSARFNYAKTHSGNLYPLSYTITN